MPVEQSYAMFAAQYDEAIKIGATAAMQAGIQWTKNNLPAVGAVMVIVCGLLLAIGQLGWGKLFSYAGRLCIVIFFCMGTAYSTMIADNLSDGIPNEIASNVNGNGSQITSAQQFDALSASTSYFTAQIKSQATGWSGIPTRMAADAANVYAKFWLRLFFYMWLVVRIVTRLLVAAGSFMLLLLLFESTRGFLLRMFSTAAGLICWQLMAAILTSIMIAGSQLYVRDALANPGASLDMQIDRLFDIGGWFLGCFVVALVVPAVAGIGGYGIASGVQGAVFGAAAIAFSNAATALRSVAARFDRNRRN